MNRMRVFAAGLLAATSLTALPAFAASDEEVAALKAQLKALTERLEALEKAPAPVNNNGYMSFSDKPAVAAKPGTPMAHSTSSTAPQLASGAPKTGVAGEGEPVVGGNMPGSFKLPGTNTSVKFGGYAKLDAIYDTNGHDAQFANFATIPLEGSAADNRNGAFNMHARQSRLNMETRTPTSIGEMKTFLEFDFFGTARGNANTTNGEGMMLRQAYGQVGKVMAGQTWSNFMDLDAYPESIDYIGSAGLTFVRQAQIRYTDSIDDKLSYAVAIESPNADVLGQASVDASDAPDVTAKLQYKDTFGHVALRGLARKINASDNAVGTTGEEDSAYGWGLGVSGKILAFEKDSFMFQAVYGDGVGHYLFDVANSGPNGNSYIDGVVDTRKAWGGYAAYQHHWSDAWRTNLIAGYTGIDNDDYGALGAGAPNPNKEVASGHINLIWAPTPVYRVGFEYMHGYRKTESGLDGELDRFQTTFMYLF